MEAERSRDSRPVGRRGEEEHNQFAAATLRAHERALLQNRSPNRVCPLHVVVVVVRARGRFEFRNELPKTMVGKVLRRALRDGAITAVS